MDKSFTTNNSYEGSDRKQSFYRRVSVHHFHVMKDQMACCCCVPLGMAYHMIAAADTLVAIILAIEALEYKVAAEEDEQALRHQEI